MRRFPRPSPALVISLLALFVALSGIGYAATGGTFILGHDNTATSQTRLVSNNAGKVLQLRQDSTATGASALGLNVKAGKPPLTTNSTTKVENLNTDLLDGLDSGNFTQGVASRTLYVKRTLPNSSSTQVLDLGWAYVTVECITGLATVLMTTSDISKTLDIATASGYFPNKINLEAYKFGETGGVGTIHVGQFYTVGGGGFPRTRLATVTVSANAPASGCRFQAQALVQG